MRFKILIICLVLVTATSVFASTKVLDAHKANSSDVAQAEKFLRDLPNRALEAMLTHQMMGL